MDAPDAYCCKGLPDTSPTGTLLCSLSFRCIHTALPQLLYITDPRQLNFTAAKILSLQSVTWTAPSPLFIFFHFLKVLSPLYYFSPPSPRIIHKCVHLAHVRYVTWFRSLWGIWGVIYGKGAGFNYLYQLHYLDSYHIQAHCAMENYLHFSLYMLKRRLKATFEGDKMFINKISE